MAKQYLKPAEGLSIPDPVTRKYLPSEGDWVESSTYWGRRLADKDVTDDTEAQTKREKAAKKEISQ